jgi:hypothetical protein
MENVKKIYNVYRLKSAHSSYLCIDEDNKRLIHAINSKNYLYIIVDDTSNRKLIITENNYRNIATSSNVIENFSIFTNSIKTPVHIVNLLSINEKYALYDINLKEFISARPLDNNSKNGIIQNKKVYPNDWELFELELIEECSYKILDDLFALINENVTYHMELLDYIYKCKNFIYAKLALSILIEYTKFNDLLELSRHVLSHKNLIEKIRFLFFDDMWIQLALTDLYDKKRDNYQRRNYYTIDSRFDDISIAYNCNFYLSTGHRLICGMRYLFSPTKKCVLVATASNEGIYLSEFIAYYKCIGFDDIIIYSNNNDDGSDILLKKYAEQGHITWINSKIEKEIGPQKKAYIHASLINVDLLDYEWAFFCDIDEFLLLNYNIFNDVKDFLNWHNEHGADSIGVNWVMVGSNGNIKFSDKPVLERFRCAKFIAQQSIKSFVTPSKILTSFAHYALPLNEISWKSNEANSQPHTSEWAISHNHLGAPYTWSDHPSTTHAFLLHFWSKSTDELISRLSRIRGDHILSHDDYFFEKIQDFLFKRFYDLFYNKKDYLDFSPYINNLVPLLQDKINIISDKKIKIIEKRIIKRYITRLIILKSIFYNKFVNSDSPYIKFVIDQIGSSNSYIKFDDELKYNIITTYGTFLSSNNAKFIHTINAKKALTVNIKNDNFSLFSENFKKYVIINKNNISYSTEEKFYKYIKNNDGTIYISAFKKYLYPQKNNFVFSKKLHKQCLLMLIEKKA